MELVYLWVEEYKNIKNQGFNFSPRFTCKYENGILDVIDKEETGEIYVKDFFGKNINITAIIGENGSGKTSLLNFIIDMNINIKKILIYFHDKNLYIKHTFNNQVFFGSIKKGKNIISTITETSQAYNFYMNNYQKIFLVNKEKNYNSHWGEVITVDFKKTNTDIQYIVNLLKNNNMEIPFTTPQYLYLDVSDKTEDFDRVIQIYIKKHKFQTNFIENDFFNIDRDLKVNRIKLMRFYLIISNLHVNNDLSSQYSYIFHNQNPKNIDDIINMFQVAISDEILSSVDKIISQINEMFEPDKYFTTFKIEINKLDNNFINNYRKITYLWQLHFEQNNNFFNFRFDKELSDGEYNFLLLFSKIFNKCTKDNILLLVDEGETSLHPNWQKQYIDYLYKFFHNNYKEKNIQLLLSSHSPFILSDLPKENVIFLEKGKQVDVNINTFGANIHTLLSHGFFMKDGLMGEFAKGKIEDVINYLNDKQSSIKNNDEAQKLLNIIGEPIIKNQLQRMLDSKRLSKVDEIDKIKSDMENLAKRLEELEK